MKAKYLAASYFIAATMIGTAGLGSMARNYSESSYANTIVDNAFKEAYFKAVCAKLDRTQFSLNPTIRFTNQIKANRAVRSVGFGTASTLCFLAAGALVSTGFQKRRKE